MGRAPLFPRWTNGLLALVAFAVATVLLLVPVALMAWVRTPYVTGVGIPLDQPIEFDHRHHVGDDGIDCLYCHDLAERSPHAGVPPAERCLNCHNQIWNETDLLSPVWAAVASGTPIVWRKVHRLPGFVYFDHSIHLAKGIGCETCHGRVDLMARVLQQEPLTMQWCLDCHRDPGPHLRPVALVTAMGWRQQDPSAGRELARRHDVQPSTNCTACHR